MLDLRKQIDLGHAYVLVPRPNKKGSPTKRVVLEVGHCGHRVHDFLQCDQVEQCAAAERKAGSVARVLRMKFSITYRILGIWSYHRQEKFALAPNFLENHLQDALTQRERRR